jgi:trimeric autotransporter adhesin
MKNLFTALIISILGINSLFAQIGINNDGSLPNPSAQLDVKSSNKGLLLPRILASPQVISPAEGLLIYNQDTGSPNYFNGLTWIDMTPTVPFSVPYTATKTSNLDLIKLNQTGLGRGIYIKNGPSGVLVGIHSGYAVVGEGNTLGGVFGASSSGIGTTGISNSSAGVYGKSTSSYGVYGYVGSSSSAFLLSKSAVLGEASNDPGVAGYSNSSSGLYGNSQTADGVIGTSTVGTGVYGYIGNSGFAGKVAGVKGESDTNDGVLGMSNSRIGVSGMSNSYSGVAGSSNTNDGVFGLSVSGHGLSGQSSTGIGVYGQSNNSIGGEFKNLNGQRSGLVASKDAVYSGLYSNNPVADLEVRHLNNNSGNGMTGLRIYNAGASGGAKAWTLYTSVVGNLELYYNGTYYGAFNNATGAYNGISDERRKENIYAIPTVLSKINLLSAKYYNYKTQTAKTIGFIAQEVEKVFPELVSTNGGKGDEYSVNYNGFGVLAVKAIQEQQSIIDDLKSNLTMLLKRIEQLERKKKI